MLSLYQITRAAEAVNDRAWEHVLISIRDVRAEILRRWPETTKEEFDESILLQAELEYLTLHHHDHPAGVDQATRDAMVKDKYGNYYIGFVLENE